MQRSFNLMKEVSKYNRLYIICFVQASLQPTQEAKKTALEGLSKTGDIIGVFEFDSDKSRRHAMALALKSLFTRDPYTINWIKTEGVGQKIRDTIDSHSIDVVHFDTISWATYFKYADGCKRVLNHHNIESHMMLRRARKEKRIIRKLYYYQEGWKLRAYEKNICNKFDLNITCSSVDTKRLREEVPLTLVDEIPNGVDLDYFYPQGLREKPESIIFAGGLSWYPNVAAINFFIKKVWPELERKTPNATMTVVGRNPPEWLRLFAADKTNFTVTGFVDDVRPYLDQAAVYVCPINDGGGTKLKILDALAMGKAIVAHPIACEGIDVTDGKDVFFAESPEDYIRSISKLFNDSSLRSSLGAAGRKLVEDKYNFVNIGKKLNRLYFELQNKT